MRRLQTIVSMVAAAEAALVTVGVLHARTKENVIPDDATPWLAAGVCFVIRFLALRYRGAFR